MIKRMKKEICSELKIISGLLLWQTYHLEMIHFKSLSHHLLINQSVIEYQFCSIRRSLTHEMALVCKLCYLEPRILYGGTKHIWCSQYIDKNLLIVESRVALIKFENLKHLLLIWVSKGWRASSVDALIVFVRELVCP